MTTLFEYNEYNEYENNTKECIERSLKEKVSIKDYQLYPLFYDVSYDIDFNGIFGIPCLSLTPIKSLSPLLHLLHPPPPTYKQTVLLKAFYKECETIVSISNISNIFNIFNVSSSLSFFDQTQRYLITIDKDLCGVFDTNTNVCIIFYKGNPIVYVQHVQRKVTFALTFNRLKLGGVLNENNLLASISYKNKKETMNIMVSDNVDVLANSYCFENTETKCKILSHNLSTCGKIISMINKNGMMIHSTYTRDTDTTYTISKCMMNDETGIRYRGTYTNEKQGDKNIKTTLQKDDDIIYNKEKECVTVDTLKPVRTENEIVIGWKVAKSLGGEYRIVKLGIPNDAVIVRPVDEDFFYYRGKQRCDKAFVMDIQLPIKDTETSVVPAETTAYSFVYNESDNENESSSPSTLFSYKVGHLVTPTSFNPDETISCTNGIHFLKNRNDVIDVYAK